MSISGHCGKCRIPLKKSIATAISVLAISMFGIIAAPAMSAIGESVGSDMGTSAISGINVAYAADLGKDTGDDTSSDPVSGNNNGNSDSPTGNTPGDPGSTETPSTPAPGDNTGTGSEIQNPSHSQPATDNKPAASKPKPKPKPAPVLSYAKTSVSKTIGAKSFSNSLKKSSKVKGKKITYSSSNKKVATVNAKGTVSVKSIGQTTIKASVKVSGKTYTAKYTLTVNPKTTTMYYVQGAYKGFSVNWKTMDKKSITGYQIRYDKKKSMKNAQKTTIRNVSSDFILFTNTKNNQNYYVQIRTYKRVSGKSYYSSWSKIKTVRTGVNSGNSRLDSIVGKILSSSSIKSKTSPSAKLRAAFDYVANYKYITSSHPSGGNWSVPYAVDMYENQGGNCYRYASLFCWLARGLGYNAKVASGVVPSRSSGWAPHGWTEIKLSGKTYICDSDMVHALPKLKWFMTTYKAAPIEYKKNK